MIENIHKLPKGWQWAKLSDLLITFGGWQPQAQLGDGSSTSV